MQFIDVLEHFTVKRVSGDQHLCLCPNHEDKEASLSLREGDGGKTLVRCFAGCAPADIAASAGLSLMDFFNDAPEERAQSKPVSARGVPTAAYEYEDEDGNVTYRVVRYSKPGGGKTFLQHKKNPDGSYADTLADARRVIYHLPEVRQAAESERRVLYVEGEKDVENLRKLGFVATTHCGGSNGWRPEYADMLKGAEVVVIPDNDAPGRKMAMQIAKDVRGARVCELPGLSEKGDVSDWIEAGGTKEQLLKILGPEMAEMDPVNWGDFQRESGTVQFFVDGVLAEETVTVLVADAGVGKALHEDEPVLTPSGWMPIKNLLKNDLVINGTTGRPTVVNGVFPQGTKDMYRVRFLDGASVLCSADHVWTVTRKTPGGRPGKWRDLTTAQIAAKAKDRSDGTGPFFVPHTPQVTFRHNETFAEAPLPPYLFGAILSDGTTDGQVVIHDGDEDVLDRCKTDAVMFGDGWSKHSVRGIRITGGGRGSRTKAVLDQLGLLGKRSWEKFIPHQFLFATRRERLALLEGLLDTDGSVGKHGIEFSSASRRLAEDVVFLARSLGYRATEPRKNAAAYKRAGEKVSCRPRYRTHITVPADMRYPVSSSYNLSRAAKASPTLNTMGRRVVSIRRAGRANCVCISVGGQGNLYLTRGLIPTHNTTLVNQMCLALAAGEPFLTFPVKKPVPVLLVEAEGARSLFRARANLARETLRIPHDLLLKNWSIQSRHMQTFDCDGLLLERQIRKSGAKVVVLDTLGYFLGEGDENSSKDWKQKMMKPLRRLRTQFGCSFIILHHEGKPSELKTEHHKGRGTSAMFGDVDVWMSLEKPPTLSDIDAKQLEDMEGKEGLRIYENERKLVWYKSKVGKKPEPVMLDLDPDLGVFTIKTKSIWQAHKAGKPRRTG